MRKPTQTKRFRSLTKTLALAFLILSTLGILFSSLLNIYGEYRNQRVLMASHQKLIAKNAAHEVRNFIDKKFQLLESSIQTGNLISLPEKKQHILLEKLMGQESAFRQIVVLDTSGRKKIGVSNASRLTSGQMLYQNIRGLLRHVSAGKPYVGSVYIEKTSNEPMVIMALPIKNVFGDLLGALTAEVNLKFMWDLVGSIKVGKTGWAYVVDPKGNLIAFGDIGRVLARENLAGLREVNRFLNPDKTDAREQRPPVSEGINGTSVVSSHHPLGAPDWAVVVELPAVEAYRSIFISFGITALALVLGVVLTVFVGLYLARRISKPIIELRNATRAVDEQHLELHFGQGPSNEIGQLAKSFEDMLQRLKSTTVSKDWFEVMVSSIGDAVIATDAASTVTFMNREAEILTGWKSSEVLNRKKIGEIFDIYNSITGEKAEIPVERVMREGTIEGLANHTVLVHRDGSKIPIDDSAAPIFNRDRKIIGSVLVFRDVSEKYQRERKLVESEKKFRAVTDSTADAIISIDSESRVVFWNRVASQIFGWEREEIMGRELTFLMPEKFREAHLKGIQRFLATREKKVIGQTMELVGLRKSGEEFPLEVTLSLWETEGEVLFTGILRDVSQKKKMEKEKENLEIQLRGAQKLEAIGQLAAGVAHEINTPAQYVDHNIKFIQESLEQMFPFFQKYGQLHEAVKNETVTPDLLKEVEAAREEADLDFLMEEIPEAIRQSLEGMTHISEIVGAMKEFSHPGDKEKVPVDLNQALRTTLTVARNEWKHVAEVETAFAGDLPKAPCMPGELNQAFLNLIVNAAHAIGEKLQGKSMGKIRVETGKDETSLQIKISDTGGGIPETVRDRIFDPFFTTKEVGKGTGQGLSIARSVIVDKHGGTIDFETHEGEGTTFIIRLPIKANPAD